jgi:calcineurin-like phosphoesterase family protein
LGSEGLNRKESRISHSENIWFTSDHHFGHANIIHFSNRPYENVGEMNEGLIARWNEVVGEKDTVYHLGDLFFISKNEAEAVRSRLNGRICLVRGNHDKTAETMKSAFEWIKDYYELKVDDEDAAGGQRRIVLCHYAFRVWDKSHHGAWHLYGHSHGSLPDDPESLSFDVGVDCHDYAPLNYAQVKAIMATKRFVPLDHHGRK